MGFFSQYRTVWRLVGVVWPKAASGISEQPWSVENGPSSLELHGPSAAAIKCLTPGSSTPAQCPCYWVCLSVLCQ